MTRQMLNGQTFVKYHQPSRDLGVNFYLKVKMALDCSDTQSQFCLKIGMQRDLHCREGSAKKESFHLAGEKGLVSSSYLEHCAENDEVVFELSIKNAVIGESRLVKAWKGDAAY